jgi:hypothetical protein
LVLSMVEIEQGTSAQESKESDGDENGFLDHFFILE